MAVAVEMHNTGDPELQRDVVVIVEHVLSDRPGEWRVSIVGSQGSDRWEMRITGLMRLSDRIRLRELPANMSHMQ